MLRNLKYRTRKCQTGCTLQVHSKYSWFEKQLNIVCIPLLSSSVPYLKVCLFSIHQHLLYLEINSWEPGYGKVKKRLSSIFILQLQLWWAICMPLPKVVCMSPLNSLRLNLIRKLDFPDPASPANTRRYIGTGPSVSTQSSESVCFSTKDTC